MSSFGDGGVTARWPDCTLLGALNPVDRRALLAAGTRRQFEPGELLIHEGDHTTDVFILVHGFVKVVGNAADGHVVLLNVRAAGDLVGELAALDDDVRSASVQAATKVTALVVAQRPFLAMLKTRPELAALLHRSVAGKLRMATRHRIDVGGAPLHLRLARVIDNLAGSYGTSSAEGVRIDVPLSQTDLASLVGAAGPSVHRELSQLRTGRIIGTGYRRLVVLDPTALRSIALGGNR